MLVKIILLCWWACELLRSVTPSILLGFSVMSDSFIRVKNRFINSLFSHENIIGVVFAVGVHV